MAWWNERKLRAPDPAERIAAAQQLAQNPSRQALAGLIRALLDPDPVVREEVKHALDACDPDWRTSDAAKREVPKLMAAVKNAGYLEEREHALKALAEIGDKRSADLLFTVLRTEKNSATDALTGLIKMRDPRAFAEAADGLRSEKREDRNECAKSLVEIGDPKAVPLLIEALSGTGEAVIEALGHFADPRAAVALVEYVRQQSDKKPTPADLGRNVGRAAAALQRIFERSASDVPATALKPTLNFEDRLYDDVEVDWSPVRKLARDELRRRGIT